MEDLSVLLDLILWDRRILLVPHNMSAPHKQVMILYPSLGQRRLAFFQKEIALRDAKAAGIPSEGEVLEMALNSGAWSHELNDLVNDGEARITALEQDFRVAKFAAQKRKIKGRIEEVRKELTHAVYIKNSFISKSAERMADVQYIYSIMMQTAYSLDGKPLFRSEAELFEVSRDHAEFFHFLVTDILTDHFLGVAKIRQVARSVEWRMFWTLQKENLVGLFGRTPADLSLNQKSLIYWSRLYDLAFDAYEDKPSSEVIEDDERFDAWLEDHVSEKKLSNLGSNIKGQEGGIVLQGEYINSCTCGAGTKSPGLGERPIHAEGCQFGHFRPYTEEEKMALRDEIQGKNPDSIRRIHAREGEFIEKNKVVDERQLRGKKSRQMLGLGQKIHKAGGR